MRGRSPGASEAGRPSSSQNIWARVPRQKPSSGIVGEACSHPPLGVAEIMLPQRSTTSMWQVSPLVLPSRSTVGSPVVASVGRDVDTPASTRRTCSASRGSRPPGAPGRNSVSAAEPTSAARSWTYAGPSRSSTVSGEASPYQASRSAITSFQTSVTAWTPSAVSGSSAVGPRVVQHGQRLEQGGPLTPQPGLGDLHALPLVHRRRLPGGLVGGEVRAADQPGQHLPAGVPPLARPERLDGLGHEAAAPRVARRLGLLGDGRRRAAGVDEPLQHRGVGRVAEQLSRPRGPTAGQPEVGRRRPVGLEELADALDGGGRPGDQRVAVARIPDRRLEDGGQRQRAVVAQEEQPGVDRAGHGRRERAGAGHVVEAERRERLAGRRRGRRSLAAQHPRARVLRGGHDGREVAARPVEVGLDDVQHEATGGRRVEGVAAELEHPLRRLRGEPVRGGDHAEGPGERGAGGEGGHRRCPSGCTRRVRSVVASMS